MLLGLLESPMRPQLIPANNGLNPEREGGVQHVGKRLEPEEVSPCNQSAQDVYG